MDEHIIFDFVCIYYFNDLKFKFLQNKTEQLWKNDMKIEIDEKKMFLKNFEKING